jgi:hypothetical protein
VVEGEFFFEVEISSRAAGGDMLTELTAQVLDRVGCSGEAVPELADALRSAVASSGANGDGRCGVQFRVRGGELQIVVSSSGGRIWQTSRAIP